MKGVRSRGQSGIVPGRDSYCYVPEGEGECRTVRDREKSTKTKKKVS